jgi:hypothetical protein
MYLCTFTLDGPIYLFCGLYNEELHNLYSSPSIIRMIKSRRIRWARHVARMGTKWNACRILVGEPEGRDHWEDRDVGGWTILGWILENGMVWIGLMWFRIGTSGGLL